MGTDIATVSLDKYLTKKEQPLVICGPCSAESEQQIMDTAHALSEIPQVNIFRAGIWKPRTRPNGFEGVGDKGLPWMKRVKEETGLKVIVEVAYPQHVEAALKHDIDMVWVGARTTTNPFLVQELADCLRGVDIPVFVKNPPHPDLGLWVGALERMNAAGIQKLVAIHRGFYVHNQTSFRNPPSWEIPIELKQIAPDLPIITDPSHICGNRDNLGFISQKAMDLEMDGLMLESHVNPSTALTDADQQLRPEDIKHLLDHLTIRKNTNVYQKNQKLVELRNELDRLDEQMIDILGKRLKVIEDIGLYKKEKNVTILQLKRWSEVVQDRLKTGAAHGINEEFLEKLLKILHEESIRKQMIIMNVEKPNK
ncbi:MAG: chorismate mutase [Hyphomicrobiales bacterium]